MKMPQSKQTVQIIVYSDQTIETENIRWFLERLKCNYYANKKYPDVSWVIAWSVASNYPKPIDNFWNSFFFPFILLHTNETFVKVRLQKQLVSRDCHPDICFWNDEYCMQFRAVVCVATFMDEITGTRWYWNLYPLFPVSVVYQLCGWSMYVNVRPS